MKWRNDGNLVRLMLYLIKEGYVKGDNDSSSLNSSFIQKKSGKNGGDRKCHDFSLSFTVCIFNPLALYAQVYLPIYFYPFSVGSQHSLKASSLHITPPKFIRRTIVIFILMDTQIYSFRQL